MPKVPNRNIKLIKIILLILSALPIPLFFTPFLYLIPALYIGYVVPFLIWKIYFAENTVRITKYSLIWKLPLVLFLPVSMAFVEIVLFFLVHFSLSLIYKIVCYIIMLYILRCLIYAMMIFIWQTANKTIYAKLTTILIFVYCMVILYFIYSFQIAPDMALPSYFSIDNIKYN